MKYTVSYFNTLFKKSQYLRYYWFVIRKLCDYGGILPFLGILISICRVLTDIFLTYVTAIFLSSFVYTIKENAIEYTNWYDWFLNKTVLYALLILFVWIVTRSLNYLENIVDNKFFEERFVHFNEELTKKFSKFNLQDIEVYPVYDMITKARSFWYGKFQQFYLELKSLFSSAVGVFSIGVIISSYNYKYTLIVLSSVVFPIFANFLLTNKHKRMVDRTTPIRTRRDYTLEIILSNRNVAEKKVDMLFGKLLRRFSKDNKYLKEENIEYGFVSAFWYYFSDVISFLTVSVLRVLVVINILKAKIDLSFGLSLFNYLSLFWSNVFIFTEDIGDLILIGQYLSYYYNYITIPTMHEISKGKKGLPNDISVLSVRNLSFSYPKTNKKIIYNLDFDIRLGERILILGKDGSGKSSIAKILTGLFKIEAGDVHIDGISIKDVRPGVWKKKFSVVFDDFGRFFYTVKECILLGDERVKFNKTRYEKALEVTELDKLFSDGVLNENQILGSMFEGGLDIPSGFWQRIAIARAIYRDRTIQIFDEAFSVIDSVTTRRIMNNLVKYWKDKIVLMIDEDDSLVGFFDNVFVLNNGKLTEFDNSGTMGSW